jgi:ubiquinone/menaquinone biosynthesis C-methylase UbiE
VTVSRKWDKRVGLWHEHVTSVAAFEKVRDRILALSRPRPSDVCVDLGAGTGFVTMALAPLVASVHAVDISPAMTEALAKRAADAGLANVSAEVTDLRDFRLPPSHADLIVSSYALHHLADADKRALAVRAARWLRPGGRLVIADMMFGRGGSQRDRAILRQKVAALAAKGVGGWWRIAKNLFRYGLRVGPERPATPEFWQQALRDAGPAEVSFQPVAAEAGIVCGVRPPSSLWPDGYGLTRAEGGEVPAEARTVKKSLVHPARYWPGGRYWPGISAASAPPGLLAASNWTHSGLMSSSIAIRAP